MFLVMSMTLLTAFAVSAILLYFGLNAMWLRYGIAAMVAYLAFFLYLQVVLYAIYKVRGDPDTIEGTVEAVIDTATDLDFSRSEANSTLSSGSENSSFSFGDLFGGDDFVVVIIGIVMILGVLFSSLYVIYIAPEMLFEIVFDALVGVGYYRVMKSKQNKHWTEGAIRATIIPFAITLIVVVLGGALIQMLSPEVIRFKDLFSR